MKIRLLNSVKLGGKYLAPGAEVDVDQETADQLLDAKAAEVSAPAVAGKPIAAPASPKAARRAAIEELRQVDGVTEAIAKELFDAGIVDLDGLRGSTTEALVNIPGIGPKTAERILADAAELGK